ncbi:restriction endonuclease subunit S [Acinetobacter indicus]|uniref:restriction endonuclease subunit S n=1 Tax=Acinetobacter indicus TaxID=756892 RepID=UPI0032B32D06
MATPKLRFKEFSGDWSNKKIGNIASKVGSGSTPRGGSEAYTDHGVIFIRSQNVNNDQLLLNDVAYIPEETHLKMSGSKVIANDILLNITGASIGRSCVVPHDFTEANVNQHVCIIRTPNDDPIFVQSFLSSENGQNAIQSKQAGGGREGLNFQAIRSIDFYFPPSKQEQTKIATFLTAVDEKISQLSQKLHLLGQYKQGMMQKLFSQQIRFKADDGSEFGEWESKTLGEVGENIIGLTYSPTDVTNDGSGILVLRSSNIKNGRLDKNDQVRVNKKIKEKIIVQPNDILICTRNGSQRLIGKSVILNDDEVMTFGAFMSVYRSRSNRFIAYLMQTPWFFEQVQMNLGARINQITTGTLNEFTFDFPCFEEQTKIADFLSSIDQKIEVVAQQIEQAKLWKKGLLQQMFV